MSRRDDVLSPQHPPDLVLELPPDRGEVRPPDPAPGSAPQGTGRAAGSAEQVHAPASRLVADVVDRSGAAPAEGYTRVLHDVPAAVLLVDVSTRRVVHANPFARRLTGDLVLPACSSDWVAAARLTAPGGVRFDRGDSPVDRAASGLPVFGEPVAVPDGADRRPLWVTGFPLPQEDEALALLVLFDVDSNLPEAQVRDRAVVAAGLSFTISDPRRDDNPLIYVNPAFERTTGYSAEEALGRNCGFLQGPETDPRAVQRIRDALEAEEHAVVTLLNHRRDGTAFWNEVSLSPVY